MSRFAMLASVDGQHLAAHAVAAVLARHGIRAVLQPLPLTPCISFRLTRPGSTVLCHLGIAGWAERHLHDLQGLDWFGMAPAVIEGLTSLAQPVTFADDALAYDSAIALGLTPRRIRTLPVVRSAEGDVWIEQLQGPLAGPPAPTALRADLPMPLSLRLGHLQLPAERLQRLRRGDIVLLAHTDVRAFHDKTPLFDYLLHEDAITVNQLDHPDAMASEPDISDTPIPSLDIGGLSLRLHVQLCELPLSVAEVSALQPGSVLSLPPRVYQQVALQHGNVRIATGELVQVGDALGVRLTQVPRPS